jgi:uncharacterized protein (DUF2252 family)
MADRLPNPRIKAPNVHYTPPMNVRDATRSYERWLSKQAKVVRADLREKHARMDGSPFEFLRATFYRWVQMWPVTCPDLAGAPSILGIGDLHLENFGTWRDSEGRLIWGINDLDEAHPVAYTSDLVRLATSAILAERQGELRVSMRATCDEILDGYADGLDCGGQPIVLAERRRWLRRIAIQQLRDPQQFWEEFKSVEAAGGRVPHAALRTLLPSHVHYRVIARTAGVGSLGRPRYVALAIWGGAQIAREAKALIPSAAVWASGNRSNRTFIADLLERAVRVPDPFYRVADKWVVRRLAPDCTKIEMSGLPKEGYELKLLRAMGWETANVHLSNTVADVIKDLRSRPKRWLLTAARDMADVVLNDWRTWKAR